MTGHTVQKSTSSFAVLIHEIDMKQKDVKQKISTGVHQVGHIEKMILVRC